MIGIMFEKSIVDDSGFPRTPDRPVELLGTRVRFQRSVETTIYARGPDFLGGSTTAGIRAFPSKIFVGYFGKPSN